MLRPRWEDRTWSVSFWSQEQETRLILALRDVAQWRTTLLGMDDFFFVFEVT